MMKLILSILILSTTVACGSGGGGSPTVPKQAVADTSGVELIAPVDYSKIACGDVEECATTCMITAPYTGEEYIRTHRYICNNVVGVTCNALIREDTEGYLASNLFCKNSRTTERIDPAIIGTSSCMQAGVGCQQVCARTFRPETDQAILNRAAANGGRSGGAVMKELIANQRVREQLTACLEAPARYVMDN